MQKKSVFAVIVVALLASVSLGQTQIRVDVTTEGPVALAPVFAAFHDGTYDIFDVDGTATASGGLETLAEVGDPSVLAGATPAGVNAAGFAPGGPFAPNGGTGNMTFTVSNSQNMFSYASMVLPTNDWFIGNNVALDISSLLGAAAGTSLSLSATTAYDAGTEEEDFMYAPGLGLVGLSPPAGHNPGGGTATSNPIAAVTGSDPFAVFANIEPAGFDTTSLDFTNGPIASVTLTVVPEPASFTLIGMAGLGLLGFRRRRRR